MINEIGTAGRPGETAGSHWLPIFAAHPQDLQQTVKAEGDCFFVRPIGRQDGHAFADFLARIDESDLHQRFGWPGVPRNRDYTRLDHNVQAMFVAIWQCGPAMDIVGEVRAYRYPDSSTVELAIIVRSDLKRRGIGRALVKHMVEYCKANGLELIAQIKPDNNAMIQLAQSCGMQLDHVPGSDLAIAHIGHSM